MKLASLCRTFRLDWTSSTSPYCGEIKSSANSGWWLNAHHISLFWPTQGDTEILAREKEPWSHLRLSFYMSIHSPDRSHLKSMVKDEHPLLWVPSGCSSFKKSSQKGHHGPKFCKWFPGNVLWIPNLPKGEIKCILWRHGMIRPDNLWIQGLHNNKTKIDLKSTCKI